MEEGEQEQEDRLQTLTLTLYDLYWFRRLILSNLPRPPPPSPPPPPPSPPPPASPSPSPPAFLLRHRSVHRRSHSDDLSSSPALTIQPPRLQTVLSGKESAEVVESFAIRAERERGCGGRRGRRERRRRKRASESSGSSKSLSDLEFEELKGFMDLGFTFSDADTDPRLREIVPGLQRLNKAEDVLEGSSCVPAAAAAADAEVAVTRPYLSEAWDVAAEEEEERMMTNLRIAVGVSEVDLKAQLRFWAQAVASTVR